MKPVDYCASQNHLLTCKNHGYQCKECMIYYELGYFANEIEDKINIGCDCG